MQDKILSYQRSIHTHTHKTHRNGAFNKVGLPDPIRQQLRLYWLPSSWNDLSQGLRTIPLRFLSKTLKPHIRNIALRGDAEAANCLGNLLPWT